MAEKPGELSIYNEPDAVSTAAGAEQDAFLEARSDNYPATDSEALEIATNTGDAPEETEHLKSQIEETRSQMGETIDAIQEKLSFQNISEQVKEQVSEQINNALETAKETVYGATIGNLGKAGKFMQNVGKELSKTEAGKFARKNPFPLVLIGLGVGLLAYELSGKKRRSRNGYNYSDDYNGESRRGRGNGGLSSSVSTTLKSAGGKISDTASNAYESVSNATGNALHSVSDAASSAYGSVSGAATNAYSSVSDFAGNAYEKVGDYSTKAREQYEYHIEENPLAVGAVALALGAAVGLAVPATRYESDLMGEYSQQLLDKAQTAAGDLVGRVKEVASEAQKTLGDEVKATLNETKKTITDEAQNQGLA